MTQMSRRLMVGAVGAGVLIGAVTWAAAEEKRMTEAEKAELRTALHVDAKAEKPMLQVQIPPVQKCNPDLKKDDFPIPDPACTPGAINPTLTLAVLKDSRFKTEIVRDGATKESRSGSEEHSKELFKTDTYGWYDVAKPAGNEGENQTCELDHLISLELGGADTLDNIWPQCGPRGQADLDKRFFKEKDLVEDYLAALVRNGKMDLAEAQKGIASDWTQYLDKARSSCPKRDCTKASGSAE